MCPSSFISLFVLAQHAHLAICAKTIAVRKIVVLITELKKNQYYLKLLVDGTEITRVFKSLVNAILGV